MNSCGYKACDVSHIYHQISAYSVGNFSELSEVDNSGISRSSCHNQLGLTFLCDFQNLIIINAVGFAVNSRV